MSGNETSIEKSNGTMNSNEQYKINASKNQINGSQVLIEEEERPPIKSSPQSNSYNRLKYYSALRTGYQQLNPENKQDFLKVPKHVIQPYLYYIQAPFQADNKGQKKQTSITTIFTCWNTMVGSGIVSLPWAFGQSGFLLGLLICIIGLIASYRTCILMIRAAGNDAEYFDTLYKYWGKWAYYCGFISTLLIMIAAVTSYFINLSQMLYYIALALIEWIGGHHIVPVTNARFDCFSLAYMAILVFIMEFLITSKKDLTIFIRLMSFGSIFIISLIVFIIGFGFYGLGSTDYTIIGAGEVLKGPPYADDDKVRNLKLLNADFSPLAGALGIGYFLHTVSLPIVKNNENQNNNERDILFGYLLVAFTYISVGIMGSIGFTGVYFASYFNTYLTTEINENCMLMYSNTDVLAFLMRFALFALLFCCFPLINHFLRSLNFQLFFRDKEITPTIFYSVNFIELFVPTMITIFYPKIGSILGYIGAVAGLLIVYVLPVITYLKKLRTELEHPLLARAIQNDQYEFRNHNTLELKSPKIVIRNAILENATPNTMKRAEGQGVNLKPFYWACFTHSFIIIYGILILLFKFYNPFKA